MSHVTIYVKLPKERVDVWHPVQAEHMFEDVYRILPQPYDPTAEEWQFAPGAEVVVELTAFSGGESLLAAKRAK